MVNALSTLGTENPQTVTLHQLLHGYAEGHRLLEGSVEIPDSVGRLVLRLSDLSGSNVSSGFEEYLTGYPLDSIGAYALAKTWYASEMPRPGCVWTHTIVIPAEALSALQSLNCLVALFRRPDTSGLRGAYAKPLVFEERREERSGTAADTSVLEQLFRHHYAQEYPAILLAARNSIEFESLLLSFWAQKWPSLRMRFTFCTGSLASRSLGAQPFNIQCVPTARVREVMLDIRASNEGVRSVVITNTASADAPEEWVTRSVLDITSGQEGSLRRFLWTVADEDSERSDFMRFVTVYDALEHHMPASRLISIVASNFHDPHSANELKRALFGRIRNFTYTGFDERELLLALSATSDYGSFDPESLQLRVRGQELWAARPEEGAWLVNALFQATLNPLGEELLMGIVQGMGPEEATLVVQSRVQLLPALFQANPSLAKSARLWSAGASRTRDLFEAVATHDDLDPVVIRVTVNALLESQSRGLIRRAMDLWRSPAVFAALDWAEGGGSVYAVCNEAVPHHLIEVIQWMEADSPRPDAVVLGIARAVAPYVRDISQHDTGVWVRTFRNLRAGDEDARIFLAAFLLGLGLNNATSSPLELIGLSFEYVHRTAWDDHLPQNDWSVVEPFVPQLSWRSNWDKCERLRRALVIAFLKYRWSAIELKDKISNRELLDQVLRSAKKVEGGDRFIRSVQFA